MANILNILDKNTGKYVSVPAIQGASAYEVALENGFEGTEQEWLASLKGEGADIDMSQYATISYVDEAIDNLDIDIDGADINLDGYATEEWTKNYITENIEEISTGYYEPIVLKGEDITDDIIAINGELPALPTYAGGTKYIVNGGVTNLLINANSDSASLYINDYESMNSVQQFELPETMEDVVSDYFVYGAYNKDLLTKTDMMEPAKTLINKYVNLNTNNQFFPASDSWTNGARLCGWSFYGRKDGDGYEWINRHVNGGTVSQKVQNRLDDITSQGGYNYSSYSDGTPGRGYRKYPCVYMEVKPYTTYTINYTGDTEGEHNYMRGLHYCILPTSSPSGGGCGAQAMSLVKHELGKYTDTFTTGSSAQLLVLFVGRLKNVATTIGTLGTYTVTSDSSANIDIDIVSYNINHLSVVEGHKTHEYYIDMIKDIDFDLSITAMSMADETVFSYTNITMPYIMKSNQYFRLNREKDIFTVSRPLVKAVDMRIDELENTHLNYSINQIGEIGKWIDGKTIYRAIMQVELPDVASSSNSTVNDTYILMQDTVDSLINIKIVPLYNSSGGLSQRFTMDSAAIWSATDNYQNMSMTASVYTNLPTDSKPTDFYSRLQVRYGITWEAKIVTIVVDYTKYDYLEDGTIV